MNKCLSVKSKKNINLQCNNKKKECYDFCSIHLKSKNIIIWKKYECNNNDTYDIKKIIKIQSVIRGYLIRKRKKCINQEEFYSLDSKYDIPNKFFFSYNDKNFSYCFDIRSLKKMLELGKNINPYTMCKFSDIILNKIYMRIQTLEKSNNELNFNDDNIYIKKNFEHEVIDLFYKFDMLDNYTNHKWFLDLTLDQLKNLYRICEDIWNYRSQLNIISKQNIVKDGIAFDIPISQIYRYKLNKKKLLQKQLLYEFNRFCSEGLTISDKKLGVMLILTALTEVSQDAANGLPQYVNI